MYSVCCFVKAGHKSKRHEIRDKSGKLAFPSFLAILTVAVFSGIVTSVQLAPRIYAQSSTATLSGSVVDERGALIVDAKVTAINRATGSKRSVSTNNNGLFLIPFLPPDHYTVRVQQAGFSTAEVTEVEVSINTRVELKIQLKVGAINESVLVEGSESLIKTESATVGTLINRQLIEDLPLNGRSFQSLVALVPGVVMTWTDATNQGQFSVNGQRADSNHFSVDGVGANFGAGASSRDLGGTSPPISSTGGTNGLVSIDALQEFSVQTSTYSAEFGRSAGGQVSVVTRSGSNQFRGSISEYVRNDALDANDWFANSKGLKKPPLRYNDFGGVFGGPLIKNRTFFFFSYEGLRLRQPVTAIKSVPSVSLRQSAPVYLQALLNAYPIPNGRVLSSTRAESTAIYANPRTIDTAGLRFDQMISDKITVFGRYNFAPSQTERRGSSSSALSQLVQTSSKIKTLTLGSTQNVTARAANELRFNYSTGQTFSTTSLDDYGGAVPPPESVLYPAPFSSAEDSGFTFSVDSSSIAVGQNGSRQRQFNLVDNLSLVRGDHHLRFGLDYRRLSPVKSTYRYSQNINTTGALALNGMASSVTINARLGSVFPIFTNFSAFGQDTWAVTPRLTLTYGLRWELNPYPREKYGNNPYTAKGGFDPAQMTLTSGDAPLWKTIYTNFAPRFGAAFLLFGESGRETVLKGGVGIFYDLGTGNASAAFSPATFPYTGTKRLRNVSLPLDQLNAAPPEFNLNPPYQEIFVFDPDLKTPRTYQWSVGVQQALGSRQSLSVSYVGAAGRKLIVDQFWAFPEDNPDYFRLHLVRDTGTSDYDSMQVQFEKRISRQLELTASYTWSHSIDTASNDSSFLATTDPEELRNERGNSDFDVRHSFSGAFNFDIPKFGNNKIISAFLGNWSLSSIIIARTAMPIFYIDTYCDVGLSNSGCPRPDLIPGLPVYLNGSSYPGGKRLNPAAFAIPPGGRQGTLGRNSLRGFPVFQMDIALRRNFRFREKLELQLTAEAFNILNHPNFGDPITSLVGDPDFDNSRFGISYQMLNQSMSNPYGGTGQTVAGLNPVFQIGGPRSIQLAVKIKF